MKWFLLAIMTLVHENNSLDTYVWYNPTFDSSEQCIDWVKNNNDKIYITLMTEFPNDKLQKILCVEEEKLKEFFERNKKALGKENI